MRTLLKTLLNFWLYPVLGMMFAAGTVVGDVASGGGDGGGSADGGGAANDSGDGGARGERVSPDAQGAQGGEGESREVPEGDGEGDGQRNGDNALVDSGDGRKIPAKYQELFKNDKALRELYFNNAALKKTFPGGVKEAVQLAQAVKQFGGVEAVEQLQSDLQGFTSDHELFESNPSEWIKTSFEANSDSALKAFAHSLDFVAENHPEQYDHYMSKVLVNTLTGANSPIPRIQNALLAMKDNADAQKLATDLYKWYKGLEDTARKVPAKQIDPQQKKLDEQKAQLTTEKQQIRNEKINTQSVPYLNKGIDIGVDKAAKAAGFDVAKVRAEQPKRYAKFVQDVKNSIYATVRADDKWLDRYSRTLSGGDTAKCVRMLNARHDQAMNGTETEQGIVASTFADWFGAPKAGTRPNANANGGNRGGNQGGNRSGNAGGAGSGNESPVLVNALPPAKDINYNDPKTDKWEGIYRLKTGKLIQVKRP